MNDVQAALYRGPLREAAAALDAYVTEMDSHSYVLAATMTDIAYEMRMTAVSLVAGGAAEFYAANAQRGLEALIQLEGVAHSHAVRQAAQTVEQTLAALKR